MRFVRIVGLTMMTLSITAFLLPVIYGLHQSKWSIEASLMPQYSPPKVGLEMGKPEVKFEERSFLINLQVSNTGEIKLTILSMDATAYGPDGAELGKVTLEQAITLAQGESKTMSLRWSLGEQAMQKLISYYRDGMKATVLLKGESRMKVFSSIITSPFTTSIS